jgi:deoxyribodipyrimidine photolyase
MKFGLLSPREIYWRIMDLYGNSNIMIRQIYWRDYFAQILWHYPDIIQSNASRPEFRALNWKTGKDAD